MMDKTYHGDPAIKAAHIAQAKHHAAADMLRAGTYGDSDGGTFRGCSVGCFAHEIDPKRGDYHAVVAESAGWPGWLVHLSDGMFEGLPKGERELFHVELRERVPVGVDLTPVLHAIAVARMDRLLADKVVQSDDAVMAAVRQVRALHERAEGAESAAWSAAWSAAESAAWSAAESAAESAAWSAAWSAAESAAESAAWSAAESAAWSAAWKQERDALYAALENVSP
jgi:hypothetical protein